MFADELLGNELLKVQSLQPGKQMRRLCRQCGRLHLGCLRRERHASHRDPPGLSIDRDHQPFVGTQPALYVVLFTHECRENHRVVLDEQQFTGGVERKNCSTFYPIIVPPREARKGIESLPDLFEKCAHNLRGLRARATEIAQPQLMISQPKFLKIGEVKLACRRLWRGLQWCT